MNKEMSFAAACKDFFGYKPGEGLAQFKKELEALTPTDKEELSKELSICGYTIRKS